MQAGGGELGELGGHGVVATSHHRAADAMGDVIRGFVFAITWGIVVGTYSSIYIAKNIVLMLGVKRDWSKKNPATGGRYADIEGN